MLPSQSNTQVYSPFGSYVVEQHDKGFETTQRNAVPEPRAEPPQAASQDVPKAA